MFVLLCGNGQKLVIGPGVSLKTTLVRGESDKAEGVPKKFALVSVSRCQRSRRR
jgi:hypothetical protein